MTTEIVVVDTVPAENLAALDTLDATAREVAITGMLDQARSWLAHAVESTAPAQDIANFKAYIATAAETAKRLKVSKEIQVDAEVMVRRSERALRTAHRSEQESGTLPNRGGWSGHRERMSTDTTREFYGSDSTRAQIIAMTDGVTDEQFDEAIDRAQEEQNVSRTNVVRKVREVKSGAERQTEKWDRVAEMAEQGYTSAQIAREVGIGESWLKRGMKDRGIAARADAIVGRSRRIDMRRVITETVGQAEALASTATNLITLDGILAADITTDEAQEWVDSLTTSIRTLSKALKTIKESIS